MRSPRLRTLLAFSCMFILGGGAFAPPEQITSFGPVHPAADEADRSANDATKMAAEADSDPNQSLFH